MAFLLYFVAQPVVAEPGAPLNSEAGVAGSAVERSEICGVSVFFSRGPSPATWLKLPLKDAAREFHKVQQARFASAAIIPFRFPTILGNEEQLREHVTQHAAKYQDLLDRFADCAQMDIALSMDIARSTASGTEYLRERGARAQILDQAAEQLQVAAKAVIQGWRRRTTSTGLRCFALLERKRVEEFNEKIKAVSLPVGVGARVSGPWPVAEFLDIENANVRSNP